MNFSLTIAKKDSKDQNVCHRKVFFVIFKTYHKRIRFSAQELHEKSKRTNLGTEQALVISLIKTGDCVCNMCNKAKIKTKDILLPSHAD